MNDDKVVGMLHAPKDENAEEPKAKVSKTVNEMVADLKYANGILQENMRTADELNSLIDEYLTRTNMTEFAEKVEALSIDEINKLTRKQIDDMFPGHELVPFDAPVVKDVEGDYGYTEDEYHQILVYLHNRLEEQTTIMKNIREAHVSVMKMADILEQTRLQQAQKIVEAGGPEAEKAQRFIDEIRGIKIAKGFMTYAIKNYDVIERSNGVTAKRKYDQWLNNHQRYKYLDRAVEASQFIDATAEERNKLMKFIMSYVAYGPSATRAEVIARDSNIGTLYELICHNYPAETRDVIRDGIYRHVLRKDIEGSESNGDKPEGDL